jgi:hypothetical protein
MKRIFTFLIIMLAIPAYSGEIPAKYGKLYNELEDKLTRINEKIDSEYEIKKSNVLFSVELGGASGNRGEILLEPNTRYGIMALLDGMLELDITAVKVSVNYPVLVESFPRSGEYLEFYKFVFDEIRQRNLKIMVHSTSVFRDTLFGGLDVDDFYQGLDLERYKSEKLQMLQTVIDSLSPDYLTYENEPSTAEMNTGIDFSVHNYIHLVDYLENNLDKGDVKSGAGAGTWEEWEIFERLAEETGIDYIDYHVYPVNFDFVDNKVFRLDSLARATGKRILMGEAWLYKVSAEELAGDFSYINLYSRDVYDFWNPLDSLFFEVMAKVARISDAEFLSFFWMQYFFNKLEFSEQLEAMPPADRYLLGQQSAVQNIVNKELAQLGEVYRGIINRTFLQGNQIRTLRHQGSTRYYTIHFPLGYNPQNDYPVVIFLHGGNGNSLSAQGFTRLNTVSDKHGFIVVLPSGNFTRVPRVVFVWADGRETVADKAGIDDVGFLNKMLDSISADFEIDEERIYLCGFSNGSFSYPKNGIREQFPFCRNGHSRWLATREIL